MRRFARGSAWTLAGYRTAWQRATSSRTSKGGAAAVSVEKAAGTARLKAAGFVFHFVRRNAVNMLPEAGCTEAEVSAIVETSEQTVRHGSRDVNKRRLARSAMRKLQEGRAETRRNLFGSSARTHAMREFGNRHRFRKSVKSKIVKDLNKMNGERAGVRTQDLQIKSLDFHHLVQELR